MISVQKTSTPKTRPTDDKLGFGQYFTDHMFVAEYEEGKGWDAGKVVPYAPFQMDPAASVLHYGQALFEGVKAFPQKAGGIKVFRPDFNADRLRSGAERLCLPQPPKDLVVEGMKALLRADADWMPKARGTSMYVRPTLIGTEGFLGVRPSRKAIFFVILSPVGRYYKEGSESVRIWIEKEDLRAAPGGLGATKAGANYAASLRAALRAKDRGYAQVLWTDVTHKFVEEVGTMNVFFKLAGKVLTPALNGSILEGGTRRACLELLRADGLAVEERAVSLDEIRAAWKAGQLEEVFGTGTAAVVTPVECLASADEVWELPKGFGPTAKRLYERITSIQYGEAPDTFGWLQEI
ncbi:MAG: branched-chain amino acid aminotransferase [Bdellovibrionaceae bacterium]|nr:branched-chain amino acid aminotransferase [Pseudobdellovibrionaceae bacterium]